MAGAAALFKNDVHDKDGNKIDLQQKCAGKVVGIYFSAHWCPPCRGFTPQLAEFYTKHHAGKNFEIIFVSSDQNEEQFKAYYQEMPWLALSFSNRQLKGDISSKYSVRGIPTLIFMHGDTGETITINGRNDLLQDPEGGNFPWKAAA